MSPRSLTIAELVALTPCELGASDWYQINQEQINAFADATEDQQWIHVDPDAAAAGPFGTTIAHGYLTLSLLPRLLHEVLDITDQTRGTNYGLEKIRFTNAVPVDSQIRLVAASTDATLSSDGHSVKYRLQVQVEIKGVEKPAMVGEVIYLGSKLG